MKFSILTWNTLADSYCDIENKEYLKWDCRSEQIADVLKFMKCDVICLQEVDHPTFFKEFLKDLDMDVVFCERNNSKDGSLIAFSSSKFSLVQTLKIHFDELAECHPYCNVVNKDIYKRGNEALALLLQAKDNRNSQIVVSTGHLYWNPEFPEVKFAQASFWMKNLATFTKIHRNCDRPEDLKVIMAGDFNSLPNSECVEFITSPSERLNLFERIIESNLVSSLRKEIRFLCDSTLGKLCRWLKLLGINATMHDDICEKKLTRSNLSTLFAKAKEQRRILLTTSRKVCQSSRCMWGHFVSTTCLEDSLVDIVQKFGITLNKSNLLTLCSKCSSKIELCTLDDPRLQSRSVPTDRDIFICVQCCQIYWWSENESSSPARAMKVAEKLFEYVQNKQNADSSLEVAMSDLTLDNSETHEQVNTDKDISTETASTSSNLNEVFAIRNNTIKAHCVEDIVENSSPRINYCNDVQHLNFQDAYFARHNQYPPSTNWNADFSGTLDYLFVTPGIKVLDSCCIPSIAPTESTVDISTVVNESNIYSLTVCNSQPSLSWPSDHFLLKADLEIG